MKRPVSILAAGLMASLSVMAGTDANIGQDRLADKGIGDAFGRGVLVTKAVDHVDSVVWQDKPASRA